jgi:hypothetical protein
MCQYLPRHALMGSACPISVRLAYLPQPPRRFWLVPLRRLVCFLSCLWPGSHLFWNTPREDSNLGLSGDPEYMHRDIWCHWASADAFFFRRNALDAYAANGKTPIQPSSFIHTHALTTSRDTQWHNFCGMEQRRQLFRASAIAGRGCRVRGPGRLRAGRRR